MFLLDPDETCTMMERQDISRKGWNTPEAYLSTTTNHQTTFLLQETKFLHI